MLPHKEPPEPPRGAAHTPHAVPHEHHEHQPPRPVAHHQPAAPTDSHELATETVHPPPDTQAQQHPKGAAQVEHPDVEVRDLGWTHDTDDAAAAVPAPLVAGLRNEDLWTLVRRFDKQVFHVRQTPTPPLGGLDMNVADDEAFSPVKGRAQLERLYMVVIVSLLAACKHLVRLRSWREPRRSAAFLAVYAAAWALDAVVPTLVAFLIVLILWRESRAYCFPPVPLALISATHGGLQKPAAGVLASEGSATGAPEKFEGEALEQEAHSFVNSISAAFSGLIVSTTAGKHPSEDVQEGNTAPNPTEITDMIGDARDRTKGEIPTVEHNRAKKPIADAVWSKARPAMHLVGSLVDTWERFANALAPTPPFPTLAPRLRLAAVLLPVLLLSFTGSSYVFAKLFGFAFGLAFFGDPVITPGLAWLNARYPRWREALAMSSGILRGIPTNAQLTITLLRVGERARAPVPPPPTSNVPAPVQAHVAAEDNIKNLEGVTEEDLHEAVTADDDDLAQEYRSPCHPSQHKLKKSQRILHFMRGVAKGGVGTALVADRAHAAAGGKHARDRRGVVNRAHRTPPVGPVCFPARYKGRKGTLFVTETATTPALSWREGESADGAGGVPDKDGGGGDLRDTEGWTVAVEDISELRKVGGLGWKTKIVVGWSLGREVMDGLVVVAGGRERHLVAVHRRDEVFNRLLSIGKQMWECW